MRSVLLTLACAALPVSGCAETRSSAGVAQSATVAPQPLEERLTLEIWSTEPSVPGDGDFAVHARLANVGRTPLAILSPHATYHPVAPARYRITARAADGQALERIGIMYNTAGGPLIGPDHIVRLAPGEAVEFSNSDLGDWANEFGALESPGEYRLRASYRFYRWPEGFDPSARELPRGGTIQNGPRTLEELLAPLLEGEVFSNVLTVVRLEPSPPVVEPSPGSATERAARRPEDERRLVELTREWGRLSTSKPPRAQAQAVEYHVRWGREWERVLGELVRLVGSLAPSDVTELAPFSSEWTAVHTRILRRVAPDLPAQVRLGRDQGRTMNTWGRLAHLRRLLVDDRRRKGYFLYSGELESLVWPRYRAGWTRAQVQALKASMRDDWGREIRYELVDDDYELRVRGAGDLYHLCDDNFDLRSAGPDGAFGTDDDLAFTKSGRGKSGVNRKR